MIDALVFVLAACAAAYLVRPALRPRPLPSGDPRARLLASRAAALRALHDLELDWATGKLSARDYAAQRAALEGEAAAIGRSLAEE